MKNKNLHTIKDTGFKIPEDYFDTLEDNLLINVKLKSKVESSGFKTPDDYFETFDEQLFKQLETKKETKIVSLFNKNTFIYVSSIAALLLLFFNLFNQTASFSFDDLETSAIDTYILNNSDNSDLAELLSETQLDESNFINYSIDNTTIDSYLEEFDENDLISE